MTQIRNQFIQKPCEEFITDDLINKNRKVDLIVFSPPYNIGRSYDKYKDSKSRDDYINWMVDLFQKFDDILEEDRVVLINLSYSTKDPSLPYEVVIEIERNSRFSIVDTITWEKPNCTPLSSSNRLDRITEHVFVMARKSEMKTFHINKKITKIGKNGVVYRTPIRNKLDCKNGKSKGGNISTFSVDLIKQLIMLYGKKGDLIYDPFMGTGTTGISSILLNCNFVGTEISEKQIGVSNERLVRPSRYVKLRYLLKKENTPFTVEIPNVKLSNQDKKTATPKLDLSKTPEKKTSIERIKELLSQGHSTSSIRTTIIKEYGEDYSPQKIHSIKTLRSHRRVREELNGGIVSFLPELSSEKELLVRKVKKLIAQGYDRDYICEFLSISMYQFYTIHGLKGQCLTIDKNLNERIKNKKKLSRTKVLKVKRIYNKEKGIITYKSIALQVNLSSNDVSSILNLRKHRSIGKKYNERIVQYLNNPGDKNGEGEWGESLFQQIQPRIKSSNNNQVSETQVAA
jgi:site-specific DNA-methyltransferase (adenine-specific)